jgi:poly(3-hydroxybutyrate) depolymerase
MRSGAAGGERGSGVPTVVFHGDADATVHPTNGEHVITGSVAAGDAPPEVDQQRAQGGRRFTRHVHRSPEGTVRAEHWVVHGSGHAWSGGSSQGSYTDPAGPDATEHMLRFFLQHTRA